MKFSEKKRFLAYAHVHNFYHLGYLVTSFGRKLKCLHHNPSWTDTDPKNVCLSHANLTVKNDFS